eukprot:422462-Rhodomonas_salina.1
MKKQSASDGRVKKELKHSYHVVYPDVVMRSNNHLMKEIAGTVKKRVGDYFQLDETEQNPVDMRVYSKDQLFRAPLCYKQTDTTMTRLRMVDPDAEDVDRFVKLSAQRQTELEQRYARALVTNTEGSDIIGEEEQQGV